MVYHKTKLRILEEMVKVYNKAKIILIITPKIVRRKI